MQRVLAARGVASRRKAEALIRAGRVSVDGQVVTELGTKVDPRTAVIRVDERVYLAQPLRYLLLNKPKGYITTTNDERGRRTVMDLVRTKERVYPVGRLDRDTEGLLLLTNDGEVANRVMHPRHGLAKEYNILTPVKPNDRVQERVRQGIDVDGRRVVPIEFRILRETRDGVLLTITVQEGMHRVVRRMMEAVGIPITRLRRVRIGPLSIAGIEEGLSRSLNDGEIVSLMQAIRLHDQKRTSTGNPRSPDGAGERPASAFRRVPRPRAVGSGTHPGATSQAGPGAAGAAERRESGRREQGRRAGEPDDGRRKSATDRPERIGRGGVVRSSSSRRDRDDARNDEPRGERTRRSVGPPREGRRGNRKRRVDSPRVEPVAGPDAIVAGEHEARPLGRSRQPKRHRRDDRRRDATESERP